MIRYSTNEIKVFIYNKAYKNNYLYNINSKKQKQQYKNTINSS